MMIRKISLIIFCSALLFGAPSQASPAETHQSVSSVSAQPRSAVDRPFVGIEVTGAATGFGDQSISWSKAAPFNKLPVRMQLDVQPLHFLGVLSAGISGEYYFTPKDASLQKAYSIGAQLRYQARFFENQLLVPMAAYSAESFFYKIKGGPSDRLIARGPTLGVWLYLNAIDSGTARSARDDLGISRTYVTLERRTLEGARGAVTLSGSTYQVGLRIEI